MNKDDFSTYLDDAKSKLGIFIKDEVKRKFVGETYSYLVKIPYLVFGLVAVVTTLLMVAIEFVLAGVFLHDRAVVYGDLLLGFGVAIITGIVVGKIYSRKVSKKLNAQISEILSLKSTKKEEAQEK